MISEQTLEIALHRSGGLCACGCGRRAEDPHHIFPKRRWPELEDEPDNIVAVARYCHAVHETAFRRFKRKLTRHAGRLVRDGQMQAYLDRTYPK